MKRMAVALLSVLGICVATYLTLYKLGYLGGLTCSIGSCETVNLSKWATFLGLPVAAWGLGFYLMIVVSVASVQPRFAEERTPSVVLTLLTGWGVLFSAWLTYLELFVIKAICQWCVVSAILVTVMFAVCVSDLRDHPAETA
jgi:uncharacterized membrane protein